MNEIASSITRRIRGGNDIRVRRSGDRIIIDSTVEQQRNRSQGGGTQQKIIEVRIVRALASPSDTSNQAELDAFNQFGPHLKCWAIDAQGNFITMQDEFGETVRVYYVVFSNWMHPISDFKDSMGNQIYNALSPTAPVFTAFNGQRGWTLSFGEGERWVPAPLQAALCPSKDATGACCLPDESCSVVSEMSCDQMCGLYLGNGSVCPAPGSCPAVPPCPDEEGACCQLDNTCTTETQPDCMASGGIFHAGTICAGFDCSGSFITCCLSASSCLMVTNETQCTAMGGFVSAADSCPQANCDLPVACCYVSGSCNDLPESVCMASGGASLGWGSTCAADGSQCPQPVTTGCCSSSGFTCYVTSVSQCMANGDNPNGLTGCVGSSCVGACCSGPTHLTCTMKYNHECDGLGGWWQGPGTTCSPSPCPGNPGLAGPSTPPPSFLQRVIRRMTGG